jgi:hypothetical protein
MRVVLNAWGLRNGTESGDSVDGLLPDPSFEQVYTWLDLYSMAPRVETLGTPIKIGEWVTNGSDLLFQDQFAVRSESDLPIRRSRFSDLWFHIGRISKGGRKLWFTKHLLKMHGTFDYIHMLNIMWATVIFKDEWFEHLVQLGAFDDGSEHFVVVTKWLNKILKTHVNDIPNKFLYYENQSLTGYRTLPFPGFDLVEESRSYAHGGQDAHHMPTGYTFRSIAERVLKMNVSFVPYISFDDYIRSAKWATGGSSSRGYLHFTTGDGKEHKIKARKNFVLDVVSIEDLIQSARSSRRQTNIILIKNELSKVRLAVASDLETYLRLCWLMIFIGEDYKQWSGSTIDESVSETTHRLESMLRLCAEGFGLPYDYENFEHQPLTDELVTITDVVLSQGRVNIPSDYVSDWEAILKDTLESFYMSTLILHKGYGNPVEHAWAVIGGLMSGLRITALVGNGWNTVMTEAASITLQQAGVSTLTIRRYFRGDDSAIFTKSASVARLFALAMKKVGAKGGEGKFSVQSHAMEFLRVWFDTRCHGYPARALPGLTQRKPWSNEPWSPDSVIKSILDVTLILQRRGLDTIDVWASMSSYWCQKHHLPKSVLQVPISLGGLGLEFWDGHTELSMPMPTINKVEFRFKGVTEYRTNKVIALATETSIPITHEQASNIASRQLQDVLAADDVPSVAVILRNKWKSELHKIRTVHGSDRRPIIRNTNIDLTKLQSIEATGEAYDQWQRYLWGMRGTFGRYRREYLKLQSVKLLLREAKMGVRQWLRSQYPTMFDSLPKGYHLSDALDWLGGVTPIPSSELHPMLKSLSDNAAVMMVKKVPLRGMRRTAALNIYGKITSSLVYHSPLSQVLYRW